MKSVSLDIPPEINLSNPHDFARNFPGEGVSIAEVPISSALDVSWDEDRICFSVRGLAVTYARAAIQKFLIDREAHLSKWRRCNFEVQLRCGTIMPIFYTDKSDEPIFNRFLASLLVAELRQVFGLSLTGRA
jgi:hypothetical protein